AGWPPTRSSVPTPGARSMPDGRSPATCRPPSISCATSSSATPD
ncbi:MAG: hypothetical protein AVDCRST_MAG38-1470, partial [uncultured Solirubrobacteraceae bacterium]